MLGIRHVHGVAFDLYQGDITGFACDAFCTPLFSNEEAKASLDLDTSHIKCAGSTIKQRVSSAIEKHPLAHGSVIVTAPGFLPTKKLIFFLQSAPISSVSCLEKLFEAIAKEQIEHISVDLSETLLDGTPILIDAFRDFAARQDHSILRRVSFIMKNIDDYLSVQNILFKKLPDQS